MIRAKQFVRGIKALVCSAAMLGGVALARVAAPTTRRSVTQSPKKLEMLTPAAVANPQESGTMNAVDTAPAQPHDALGSKYRNGLLIDGATSNRLLLFSFDDGPDIHTTPILLERLQQEGIRAVFFLVASRIAGDTPRQRRQAELAREIARRGHLIGNHTVDHILLTTLNDQDALRQITDAEAIFERVLGGRPWLMRPPGGARSPRIDRFIEGRDYTMLMWNLGAGDAQVAKATAVATTWKRVHERRQRENSERGGVILLHDTHAWSIAAFDLILAEIRARNCQLLATNEELYDIVDDVAPFFQPRSQDQPAGKAATPAALSPDALRQRQEALRAETARRCLWQETQQET